LLSIIATKSVGETSPAVSGSRESE
jgi:hypothetical protein